MLVISRKDEKCAINFSSGFSRTMRLFEISPSLEKEIQAGESLYIKGTKGEEAVICTSKSTFAMKRIESSNAVFLVNPSIDTDYRIQAGCSDYYELKAIEGRLSKLKVLVDECNAKQLPYEEALIYLQQNLTASNQEIQCSLQKLGILNVKDRMYLMSFDDKIEVIERLFLLIIQRDWSITQIPQADCLQALESSFPATYILYILHVLGQASSASSASSSDAAVTWSLAADKVARWGIHLVFARAQRMAWAELVQEWTLRTPWAVPEIKRIEQQPQEQAKQQEQVIITREILYGIAIEVIDQLSSTKEYCYLPIEMVCSSSSSSSDGNLQQDVSQIVKARLQQLFAVKGEYRLVELAPYIENLLPVASNKVDEEKGGIGVAGDEKRKALLVDLLLPHTKVGGNGLYRSKY